MRRVVTNLLDQPIPLDDCLSPDH